MKFLTNMQKKKSNQNLLILRLLSLNFDALSSLISIKSKSECVFNCSLSC